MDENKIITEALDSLIPDNQQKDDIWQRIEACTEVYDLDKTARTEVTAKKSSKKSREVLHGFLRQQKNCRQAFPDTFMQQKAEQQT